MPRVEVVRRAPTVGLCRAMLARARATGASILAVGCEEGEGVALGRYHVAPPGLRPARRLTGGRAVPTGDGFVAVAVALPHRSAIGQAPTGPLRPEQTMNRCVRGLLGACAAVGVEAHYPGRDLVTAGGRPIAWLALTEDAQGTVLFEAGLAVTRDFSALAPRLDAVDPGGVVPMTLWLADDVTSMARECDGRTPAIGRLLDAVVDGYHRRLDLRPEPLGDDAIGATDEAPPRWDAPAAACRLGETATQLGVLRIHVVMAEAGRIAAARLVGDVLAPEATVTALEEALVGCAADRGAIERALRAAMAAPARWMLGADPVRDVAAATLRGVGR